MDKPELMLCGGESAVQGRVRELLRGTLEPPAMTLAQTAWGQGTAVNIS